MRCLLGKNVGVAKMPEIKLSVDYIITPGHLKSFANSPFFFLLRQKLVEG